MTEKQVSVLVGKLSQGHTINTESGECHKVTDWQGRAAWSYLRLAYGRKIDAELKSFHGLWAEFKSGQEGSVYQLLRDAKQDRPLQFIMSSNNVVLAVASTKHLLVEPRKVYETATDILGPAHSLEPSIYAHAIISPQRNLHGETFMTGQGFAGIQVGYQVDGGDLVTRSAIRVGVFARVELCFNPLSWLGVSGLNRFGVPADYERVLRIKKLNELFPRLKAALTNAEGRLDELENRVEATKTVSLSSKKATMITGAFCMAYGLGEKVIAQVMDRWWCEKKTQYGLAMAQSYAAQHAEHRQPSEGMDDQVPQKLSTISGATLLIDAKAAAPKVRAWLQGQKSPLAEKLLNGKLP